MFQDEADLITQTLEKMIQDCDSTYNANTKHSIMFNALLKVYRMGIKKGREEKKDE